MDRTIIDPLTTVFQPPPECTALRLLQNTHYSGDVGHGIFWGLACSRSELTTTYTYDSSCFPVGAENYITPRVDVSSNLVAYSPASQCPEGFHTACSFSKASGGSVATAPTPSYYDWVLDPIERALGDGESYIGCCPVGFECHTSEIYRCVRSATGRMSITGITYDSFCQTQSKVLVLSAEVTVVAEAYQVPLIVPSATTTSRATAQDETSSATDDGAADDTGGDQLSIGAKVGICLAVTAVVAILGFVIIRLRHHRLAKQDNDNPRQELNWYWRFLPFVESHELDGRGKPTEMASEREAQELDPKREIPAELENMLAPQELSVNANGLESDIR